MKLSTPHRTAAFALWCLSVFLMALPLPTQGHETLPLGDGYISTQPKVGFIYSCQQQFGIGGAGHAGSWINGTSWDPDQKPQVQGSVTWPDSSLTITEQGNDRIIRANLLPTHTTGQFPISRSDPAYYYDINPNTIQAKSVVLKLPLQPQLAAAPTCVSMGMIGVLLTGTALFNGLDGGGRDAAAHELQDSCNGHPEPSGVYHYHSYSPCLVDKRDQPDHHSSLMGYALDGFGIFGPYGEGGRALGNQSLDACHGHTHAVYWNGSLQTIYHYHFTPEYPYSLGCYRGTPTSGGNTSGHGPQNNSHGFSQPQGRRQPPDLNKVAAELGISVDSLRNALGPPPAPGMHPDFKNAADRLGINEEQLMEAIRHSDDR